MDATKSLAKLAKQLVICLYTVVPVRDNYLGTTRRQFRKAGTRQKGRTEVIWSGQFLVKEEKPILKARDRSRPYPQPAAGSDL